MSGFAPNLREVTAHQGWNNMIRHRFYRATGMTLFFTYAVFAGIATANLTWEDHYTDEDPIADGSSIVANSTTVSFDATVFSDSDGGTYDLVAFRSTDFISYESGQTGGQSGNIELAFDNQNDDPVDYVELTLNFQPAVTALTFSVLDLDGQQSSAWDDGVEIYYNGINIKTNPALYTRGSIVFLDNESYMDGFESGTTSAAAGETTGNVNVNLASLEIDSATIKYFSTDDAVANPSPQFVGISDLTFTPVPEPTGLRLALTSLCIAVCCRKRGSLKPMVVADKGQSLTR